MFCQETKLVVHTVGAAVGIDFSLWGVWTVMADSLSEILSLRAWRGGPEHMDCYTVQDPGEMMW